MKRRPRLGIIAAEPGHRKRASVQRPQQIRRPRRAGDIDSVQTYCARAETDDSGRFHFPAQDQDFQLVITHPSGFAHIKSTPEWELTRIIHLEPWCRVEGTFRVGQAVAPNVPIGLDVNRLRSYGKSVPNIFTNHVAITGPDGRFVFDRVIPGNGWIGREITYMVVEGATEVTSSCTGRGDLPCRSNRSSSISAVPAVLSSGRLQPPEGFNDKVRWSFAMLTFESDIAE